MVNFSEQITGLSDLGTDLGAFLVNITPGIIGFVAGLAIAGAIVSLIVAIGTLIKRKLKM